MGAYSSIFRPLSTFNTFSRKLNDSTKICTVSVSWKVKREVEQSTSWKVWKGASQFVSWLVCSIGTTNVSWRLPYIIDSDISWKIWNELSTSSAWNIQTSIFKNTAWRMPDTFDVSWAICKQDVKSTSWRLITVSEKDISWKIWLGTTQDVAWKIQNSVSKNTSWRMPDTFDVSWGVSTSVENNSSWKVYICDTLDSSWNIYTAVPIEVSWLVQTKLEKDTAFRLYDLVDATVSWNLGDRLETSTSYRVQPAILQDATWYIQNSLEYDTSWMVKRSPDGRVSWKINENAFEVVGVNTHTVTVVAGGTTIVPLSVSLNTDVSSMAWNATLVLETEEDYDTCVAQENISITIDAVSWNVVVRQQDKNKAFVAEKWNITALSSFGVIAQEQISIVLEGNTLVSDIFTSVVAGVVSASWKATDWELPVDTIIANNATRQAVLTSLVDAVGAEIITYPDGTLEVVNGSPSSEQKIYPTANWGTDVLYSIATKSNFAQQIIYECVLVGSSSLHVPRKINIQILENDHDGRVVIVGVRVAPDAIQPEVSDCGPSNVTHSYQGSVTETFTDIVSFKEGVASTSNTIEELISVDWQGHTNLGNVRAVGSNQLLSDTAGSSLAEVSYTVRYFKYRCAASGEDETQTVFCATVPPLSSDILVKCCRVPDGLLSPEVLTSPFTNIVTVAKARGKAYLDKQANGNTTYNVSKIWDGTRIPNICDVIVVDGITASLTSLNIAYTFPEVSFSATLGKVV